MKIIHLKFPWRRNRRVFNQNMSEAVQHPHAIIWPNTGKESRFVGILVFKEFVISVYTIKNCDDSSYNLIFHPSVSVGRITKTQLHILIHWF